MRAALLLLLALAAGCSVRGGVQAGSEFATSRVGLSVQTGSTAAALIGLGFVAGTIHGGARAERPPELDATRSVREQDCTRPIEDPSANLRCR